MPNWCSVDYKIEASKDDLKNLYEALLDATNLSVYSRNIYNNGNWIANLLKRLGVKEENGVYELPCRGEITFFEYNEDDEYLSMSMETAWNEYPELRKFLEDTFNAKIYYMEEECGCEVFYTNDKKRKYFKTKYRTYFDKTERDEYFDTFTELNEFVKESIGVKGEDFEDLLNAVNEYNEKNEYEQFWINEFEYSE